MIEYTGTKLQDMPAAVTKIPRYTLVYNNSGVSSFVGDSGDQATEQQRMVLGVFDGNVAGNDAETGDEVSVWIGVRPVLAGAGGVSLGDEVIVEVDTGRVITATGIAVGDCIVGVCVKAASEGDLSLTDIRPRKVYGTGAAS